MLDKLASRTCTRDPRGDTVSWGGGDNNLPQMHLFIMIREERQREAVDSYTGNYHALINAAPRFGKIKVTIDIFRKHNVKKAFICIPRLDIRESWEKDFIKWGWEGEATFTTHRSMGKTYPQHPSDMVVIDEIHECSANQLKSIKLMKSNKLLALSGTITKKTEKEIGDLADIYTCYEYGIEQAVREGILCDYQITIHKVSLDDKVKKFRGKTEKTQFKILEKAVEKKREEQEDTFFLYLQQIQLIQGSIGKMEKTKDLLMAFRGQRVLGFCGTTEVADQLGAQVYHSKKKEKAVLERFCNGEGDEHLITIKMAQAGLTILPIDLGLINYTSGNPEDTAQKICRFLGYEYANPEKKANIHIVVSNEKFEMERISTSLMFFDKDKIKYV